MTRSIRVRHKIATIETRNAESTNRVARATRGSAASRIASVSDWNRRTVASEAWLGDKGRAPEVRFVAADRRPQMPVLLVPQRAVDIIPLQQLLVPPDIVDHSAIEHENGIRRC